MATKSPRRKPVKRFLVNEPLQEVLCLGCSKKMLQGRCDGVEVVLQPVDLNTVAAELQALLRGTLTFDIVKGLARARTAGDVQRRDYPVFAEHQCSSGKVRTRAIQSKPKVSDPGVF